MGLGSDRDKISGVSVTSWDQIPATPDPFRIKVYLESTPTSNVPAKTPISLRSHRRRA